MVVCGLCHDPKLDEMHKQACCKQAICWQCRWEHLTRSERCLRCPFCRKTDNTLVSFNKNRELMARQQAKELDDKCFRKTRSQKHKEIGVSTKVQKANKEYKKATEFRDRASKKMKTARTAKKILKTKVDQMKKELLSSDPFSELMSKDLRIHVSTASVRRELWRGNRRVRKARKACCKASYPTSSDTIHALFDFE